MVLLVSNIEEHFVSDCVASCENLGILLNDLEIVYCSWELPGLVAISFQTLLVIILLGE